MRATPIKKTVMVANNSRPTTTRMNGSSRIPPPGAMISWTNDILIYLLLLLWRLLVCLCFETRVSKEIAVAMLMMMMMRLCCVVLCVSLERRHRVGGRWWEAATATTIRESRKNTKRGNKISKTMTRTSYGRYTWVRCRFMDRRTVTHEKEVRRLANKRPSVSRRDARKEGQARRACSLVAPHFALWKVLWLVGWLVDPLGREEQDNQHFRAPNEKQRSSTRTQAVCWLEGNEKPDRTNHEGHRETKRAIG